MKPLTKFDKHARVFSNPGSPYRCTYSASYTSDGRLELVEGEPENIYEQIQMYADDCDLNILLKRYQNGEVDVFNQVETFYADVADMPRNYAELLNKVSQAENFFSTLPSEIRERFNNSPHEFLASVGDEDFLSKFELSTDYSQPVENLTEEVHDES